jgi:protein-disulfide isomerase-like protein with CxxC motif
VEGKRVRYAGPVKYFILTLALTTFATTQLGVMNEVAGGLVEGTKDAAPVTVEQASHFMSQWMTLFMALGVPFTAAVTRRLFSRAAMTCAEHLVLNLYAYASSPWDWR